MSETVLSPWLRVPQAAEYANVPKGAIFRACADRKLEHVKIGGRRVIVTKHLWIDAWLDSMRVHVQPAGGAR